MLRRLIRLLKWTVIVFAVFLTVLVLVAVATPQGRTTVRTALFLPQILPGFPIKPMEWVTGSPSRQEVSFPLAAGNGVADLYVPSGEGKHSAVLLFLGVNPAGRDDKRIVGLAEGLARAGIAVMIPWSDTMTQRRIAVEEIDNLVMAFQYLRGLDIIDPDKVGMGGFCVGASLATVAAQDPRIAADVKFVNFFGGYYDARDLIRSVVTHSRYYGDVVEPWEPDSLSVEVVYSHLIEGVSDLEDRELLASRFIAGNRETVVEIEALSPDARAVYALLTRPAPEDVDRLLGQLSPDSLAVLRTISPSTNIDQLQARVLIMHDREDDLVPAEESRRLADALPDANDPYYTEFSLFQHLDPTKPVSPPVYVKELFKLFLHMYNIIREMS